jgi:hypothetical protein
MPDVVRLYLITDNPTRALAYMFGCAETNKPSWAKVVSDPDEILLIPDGAKCHGVWFTNRKHKTDSERSWVERRLMGGIAALDDSDWNKLFAWLAKRSAKPTADIPEIIEDIPELRVPPDEIRNLVQSQRWT